MIVFAVMALRVVASVYVGLVTGAVPIDIGIGRQIRPLGPQVVDISARRELVSGIVAAPYLRRQPRAVADKVRVLQAGH